MNNVFKWKITQFTFIDNNLRQISTVQCYNQGTMTKVKTVWYSCIVTVTVPVTIVWKRWHLYLPQAFVVHRQWHVLVAVFSTNICIFVRPLPWWLLFNELMNKACHYSLIITQFRDCYIQVKDNEIVDSGSLKGDRVRYVQVTAICRSTYQYL